MEHGTRKLAWPIQDVRIEYNEEKKKKEKFFQTKRNAKRLRDKETKSLRDKETKRLDWIRTGAERTIKDILGVTQDI